MTMIRLHRPIASHPDLLRLHLFAGRHLGEDEFDQRQSYAEARLAGLMTGQIAGVMNGLTVKSREQSGAAGALNLTVYPGSGITPSGAIVALQTPLYCSWQDLVNEYLTRRATSEAAGVYYLTLYQSQSSIDPPNADPCQRTAFDPTRDTQLVALSSLRLRRLSISVESVRTLAAHELQNTICADRVDADFLSDYPDSVPLALVAFDDGEDGAQLLWVSEAAGRYEARRNAGYFTLLNQTQTALTQLMTLRSQASHAAQPLEAFLEDNLHLNYLPAAGQLPLPWLQDIAGIRPHMTGLPAHLGVDMIPVAMDTLDELLTRHLPRRVIDLTQPAGDRIRLMLAMKRADYRADLLDIPATDSLLESDIYSFFQAAYQRWMEWNEIFLSLYHIDENLVVADGSESGTRLTMDEVSALKLPVATPYPLLPRDLFRQLLNAARRRLELGDDGTLPYPYSKYINDDPTPPQSFTDWVTWDGNDYSVPQVTPPEGHGLIGEYAATDKELEQLAEDIQSLRTRLERTRDMLLLKRQQLDSQTVSMAALAGGVAGDGKGLQVARWMPYVNLTSSGAPTEATTSVSAASKESTSQVKVSSTSSVEKSAVAYPVSYATVDTQTYSKYTMTPTATQTMTPVSMYTPVAVYSPQSAQDISKTSGLELEINQNRLDAMPTPKAPVTEPAYTAKEFNFGVIEHISPEINEYAKAYSGMQDILDTVDDVFEQDDAAGVRTELERLSAELQETSALESAIRTEAQNYRDNLEGDEASKPPLAHVENLFANQKRYQALFLAGKTMTRWISVMEGRYNTLEKELKQALRRQVTLTSDQEKRKADIRTARISLRQLDSTADEALGDYGLAQQLLDEDWQRVYAANEERTRILTTQVVGLYYVRVRQTEVSRRLADPLPLRRGNPKDLVPGCTPDPDADIAEALLPFLQTVREIPLQSWVGMSALNGRLNTITDFSYMASLRDARMTRAYAKLPVVKASRSTVSYTQNYTQASAAVRSVNDSPAFSTLASDSQKRVAYWAAKTLPVTGIMTPAMQVAAVISLEDIQNHSNRRLRTAGRELLEKLEQCQICLQQALSALPGSVRLRWGQLAEDNLLAVETISRWPGLRDAEESSFSTTRTLAALIDWWFAQMSESADTESRQAMRDMIRASVIYASLGNPQEIVRGTVFSPPKKIYPGEQFRITLNRVVMPGRTLQLLTKEQEVAAELTIEENDAQGTRVRITKVMRQEMEFTDQVSVIGRAR